MNQKTTERIIAMMLLVWAIILLYPIATWLQVLFSYKEAYNLSHQDKVSNFEIVKKYHHTILLFLLGIFSSVFLWMSKKNGWLAAISSAILFATIDFIPNTSSLSFFTIQSPTKYFMIVVYLLWLICLLTLISNAYRTKYKPTAKNWITVGIIVVIVIGDKIFI